MDRPLTSSKANQPLLIASTQPSDREVLADLDNVRQFPGPARLQSQSQKTVKGSFLAIPAFKNIGGGLAAAGFATLAGSPWALALIGIGAGTSWAAGIGIAFIAVGITLWLVSTYLSMKEKPAGQSPVNHLVESAGMAAVGIPCTILNAICKCHQSADSAGLVRDRLPATPNIYQIMDDMTLPEFEQLNQHMQGLMRAKIKTESSATRSSSSSSGSSSSADSSSSSSSGSSSSISSGSSGNLPPSLLSKAFDKNKPEQSTS